MMSVLVKNVWVGKKAFDDLVLVVDGINKVLSRRAITVIRIVTILIVLAVFQAYSLLSKEIDAYILSLVVVCTCLTLMQILHKASTHSIIHSCLPGAKYYTTLKLVKPVGRHEIQIYKIIVVSKNLDNLKKFVNEIAQRNILDCKGYDFKDYIEETASKYNLTVI